MVVQTTGGVLESEFTDEAHRLVVIESTHHEIHEGETFTSQFVDLTLALNETIILAFKVQNDGNLLHMVAQASTLVSGHLDVLEGPTWTTGTGAQNTVYNRNRDGTPASSGILEDTTSSFVANDAVVSNPTGLSGGTLIQSIYGFGATQRISSEAREDSEWVLKANTTYAIRFVSDANSNKAQVILNWYEHPQEIE